MAAVIVTPDDNRILDMMRSGAFNQSSRDWRQESTPSPLIAQAVREVSSIGQLREYLQHVGGCTHKVNSIALRTYLQRFKLKLAKGGGFCDICKVKLPAGGQATHDNGKKHRALFKLSYLQKQAHHDGITISEVKFNEVTTTGAVERKFSITSDQRVVVEAKLLGNRGNAFRLGQRNNFPVSPQGPATLTITCHPRNTGLYRASVVFTVRANPRGGTARSKPRVLTRAVCATVDNEVTRDLKPTQEYKRKRRTRQQPRSTVVRGVRPKGSGGKATYRIELPVYNVPSQVRAKWRQHFHEDLEDDLEELVGPVLNQDNYQDVFSRLLHLEELQMEEDIRNFDIDGAKMTKTNAMLKLNVPGLAEKRPSVMYGDRVYARDGDREMEGFVHDVQEEVVLLKFHHSFHAKFVNGAAYRIRFTFTRTTLRRQHQHIANALTCDGPNVFPVKACEVPLVVKARCKSDTLNKLQRTAVDAVTEGRHGRIPYVIFGPPGTGKTTTVVAAAREILHNIRTCRILLVAPSNAAADLLLLRLATGNGRTLSATDMLRVNAFQRPRASVPPEMVNYCRYNEELRAYVIPSVDDIKSYRVVVSTCMSAGVIYSCGVGAEHFTHIIIDEAGHAAEPELMVGVTGLAGPNTRVVLAGDPKQLGPVIRNAIAKPLLGRSLLERLLEGEVHSRNKVSKEYDYRFITMLTDNYRSHPELLRLPSEMFYDSLLNKCADDLIARSLEGWDKLEGKFPIIFHGVNGRDMREGNSPSWYNPDEISQVMYYIESLLEHRQCPVQLAEIGIISPYRKQVQKFRSVLKKKNFTDIKVGSVEEFQGQERRVIIISTVRSSTEQLQFDYEHNLGFLRNPKRLNVAITRARAAMVVVGNPNVLNCDPHWKQLLQFCRENNACRGDALDTEEGQNEEMDAILELFDELNLEDREEGACAVHTEAEWVDRR